MKLDEKSLWGITNVLKIPKILSEKQIVIAVCPNFTNLHG